MVPYNTKLLTPPVEEHELIRQLQVARCLIEAMDGSLPREQIPEKPLTSVLDVACGAGGWSLALAQTFPSLHVTGIDSSEAHLAYAQRQADEGELINAHFLAQDLSTFGAGPFAPASFDLINIAFIAPTLLTTDYAALMHALFRLCCPGGMVRWTEMELPLTNSLAFEQLMALICRALQTAGHTFIPPAMQYSAAIFDDWRRSRGVKVIPFERRQLGITPMMSGWLREAGYREVESFPVSLEVSAGTKAHVIFVQQVEVFGQQIAPFLCEQGVTATEELARLLIRVMDEIQHDDFCGLCWLLTLSGSKAR